MTVASSTTLHIYTHYTHTHPFNGPFSGTTWVSRYQKGKTNLDFTEARDSVWKWHQLGHTQVCTSLQADNHSSTPPLSFLQAGCPSCRPTNSVKALKAQHTHNQHLLAANKPVQFVWKTWSNASVHSLRLIFHWLLSLYTTQRSIHTVHYG